MKKFAILLSALSLSIAAHAAAPTEESIDKLLSAMQAEKILDSVKPQMDSLMKKTEQQAANGRVPSADEQKIIDKFRAKAVTIVNNYLTMATLKPMYVRIYSDNFTQEEIDNLIAFYDSPTGKMFVKKMPMVMQSLLAEMPKTMTPMIQEIQQLGKEMKDELEALHKQGAQ